MKKFVLQTIILALAMTAFAAEAAGVSFSAQAPRQVVQGNRFSVVYVLRVTGVQTCALPISKNIWTGSFHFL